MTDLNLVDQPIALTDRCDIALQQQQRKLEHTVPAFARIKAQARKRVGSQSHWSLHLARTAARLETRLKACPRPEGLHTSCRR